MPFPDDLLNPIEGPNPSGANLRYDPVYDKIKEARREEDQPPPGMTERDRKVAENPLVIKLVTDLLTKKTKDLQLAAWLTEALLKQKGFGSREGFVRPAGLPAGPRGWIRGPGQVRRSQEKAGRPRQRGQAHSGGFRQGF